MLEDNSRFAFCNFQFAILLKVHSCDSHRGDSFFASDEAHALVRRRLDSDLLLGRAQRRSDLRFHRRYVRKNLWRLRNDRGVNVYDPPFAQRNLPRGFLQKNLARGTLPTRI